MTVRPRHSLLLVLLAAGIALLPLHGAAQSGTKLKRPPAEAKPDRQPARARAADAPPIKPEEGAKREPVVIDADHMESLRKEGLVIFTGNVVARQNNAVQYADRMEVYLDERGERVLRTVSTGNVRVITKDCQIGTAQRGEYDDLEQRVVLMGNARVWQDDNVVTGERITIYLAEERSVVQGGKQERVKAVFHPKPEDRKKDARSAGPAACR